LPQVASFDTAFHTTQPDIARTFALPHALSDEGIMRYGFHGLSYEYIASVLHDHLGAGADGRVVIAHLGAGASMCALHRRRSVATTMGFTALDGLPMGTRTGALDPGVILHLMSERGMTLAEITELLYKRSGLLGISGVSSDVRDLLASDSPRAARALDVFQPDVAQAFALPHTLSDEGVKRYGFHGLSYEYIASVLHEHLGAGADGRIVVAHLGAGA